MLLNRALSGLLAALLVLTPTVPAIAANREHQLMMAEIRMLQEQTLQLQQMITTLADSVKVVTSKLDDQSTLTRKTFADQKVLVDNVAEGVRVLREKVDETNVRISSLTQEMETLRIAMPAQPTAPVSPTGEGETPERPAGRATAGSGRNRRHARSSSTGRRMPTTPPASGISRSPAFRRT